MNEGEQEDTTKVKLGVENAEHPETPSGSPDLTLEELEAEAMAEEEFISDKEDEIENPLVYGDDKKLHLESQLHESEVDEKKDILPGAIGTGDLEAEGLPFNNEQALREEKMNENNEVLTAEDAKELAPLYSNVILALKQVYDPEIPVNIYDLGLIYELVINKKREVNITMTFTAPNCPMADEVMNDVKVSVEDVPGVTSCNIELVFEPAWDKSMLSEEAKVELGIDD